MAYPGRPAMVPGIPMGGYMPVMAMPNMVPARPFRPRNSHNNHRMYQEAPRRGAAEAGPTITLFIGNIIEHAPDLMVKHILATCGQVVSWKRIQGFGFCEFGSPESALRAIRVLHDMSIGAKKLVVKVDANTTVKLNDYKKAQRKRQGKPEVRPGPNEEYDLEDYVDDQTRHADRRTHNTIYQILNEFHSEMENALLEKEEEELFNKEIIQHLPDPNRAQRSQEMLTKLSKDAERNNLVKEEFEDGKRDLITREIGKFREIMAKQEAEREEERLRREQERQQEKSDKPQSPSRSRSLSTVRSCPRSPRSPSKPVSPEPRHRVKRERRGRTKSRSRERERQERDRERERERERDREQPKTRVTKRDLDRAAAREVEEEEEAKELKKLEKKSREKEVVYQERVRLWESRERRKRKDHEKEKDKRAKKEEEMTREAKKLKEFLEDYDDERDDSKFYKGRELARRTAEREKERESDDKDRMREKEEIEELRNKVLESEHADPTAVYEQLLQEHEDQYKPKIIIDVNAEQMVRQREREKEREKERQKDEMRALEEQKKAKEAELMALNHAKSNESGSDDSDDDRGNDFGAASPANNSHSDDSRKDTPPQPTKKKKLDVKDVFNADEDEDASQGAKRRKLVPLDYEDKERNSKDKKKDKKEEGKGDDSSKSTEEKRKHIKSLIDKIPTDKGALFDHTIDWTMVDNTLMEKRIRPWINKKIIEYIGEPEPTLVDFICSKVLAGSQPQSILDDVQMVLDEEAEVFVVKMWRLLIYEIEAKKMGFVK